MVVVVVVVVVAGVVVVVVVAGVVVVVVVVVFGRYSPAVWFPPRQKSHQIDPTCNKKLEFQRFRAQKNHEFQSLEFLKK